ncbi:MAG: pilus assembly protein PilP [Rickettsiales bacterium]|nr:pilus assembly protein PilP [Rickettsiales bacterium]|tara:strand:+ start:768 stop:1256 length:489 start_codon:yes stop_codon:yes gene_type:complete
MNFFRIFVSFVCFVFISVANAENHDKSQNIVEKAKEINQKIKKEQAIKSTTSKEEPLPLNDPFVGDGSLGGSGGIKLIAETDEQKRKLSVFNFKLIGVIGSENDLFASLINEDGEILTLGIYEELSPGIKLVGVNTKEIIFERDGASLVSINFKNQIIERDN